MNDGSPKSFHNSSPANGSIIVIADDLTGAAELAGIGLRYNLDTKLFMSSVEADAIDTPLLVVCTDSRSLTKENAKIVTARVSKEIGSLNPNRIWVKQQLDKTPAK